MTLTKLDTFSVLSLLMLMACSGGEEAPDAMSEMTAAPMAHDNDIIRLLDSGQPVFGMFAPEQSAEGGVAAAANMETDFIFYSLESGPWDIPTMQLFMASMAAAAAGQPHPVVLRIPPIRDDPEAARTHMAEGLAAGIDGLVLPHVETVEGVAAATQAVGDRLWPLHPTGDVLNIILIEDQVGIGRAREIVGAPGVGVAIPGPGDLRRAYEGDMEAVENAIQTVLAACKEFDVPCGITAGPDDIVERLEQGFEMIIVTRPEALSVGLMASGRGG
ncbi:MAG: aldolase/citrate lyase family protein [Gemmatimonadota bacterium]|nr:aldolase/citrate lyase family protein [Gemmatimonadota bacterium]MDH3423419.1 aldolase/citrate lyase family protein [Gemmatimonadota bacterium]